MRFLGSNGVGYISDYIRMINRYHYPNAPFAQGKKLYAYN